jgi:transcriptional regulator with XRE-family HTH domain
MFVDTVCEEIGYPLLTKDGDGMQFSNEIIGKVIKEKRIQKGMTQELLSGLAGIARTHLTMIENGTKQPNFETVWKIALALDIKPSQLVSEIEAEILNTTVK